MAVQSQPNPPPRWPPHLHVGALRWVRSSSHYEQTVAFYRDMVGLPVIDSFQGSYGEDGTIFGLPGVATHLEIVRSHETRSADAFDQIVFYLPNSNAVDAATAPLRRHGLTPESEIHLYWAANGGVVFLDPDGRGVVFAPWIYGREVAPVNREPHG